MTRVALIQLDCSTSEPVADRVERAMVLVREAAAQSDLVVLPELWNTGAFELAAAGAHAEPIDGPLVQRMGDLAAELGTWLYGGSFTEEGDDGRLYNTSVLFTDKGALLASYRKIHLFGFSGGEADLMSGGEELVVVDSPLGITGLATCYDLRFPELFRALTEGEATAVLMASGWPITRIAHWDVLTRARAIENQVWIVACNEVGEQGALRLGGHSVVVDPQGSVVAQGGEAEEIIYADVDPSASQLWREQFPVLKDIRVR